MRIVAQLTRNPINNPTCIRSTWNKGTEACWRNRRTAVSRWITQSTRKSTRPSSSSTKKRGNIDSTNWETTPTPSKKTDKTRETTHTPNRKNLKTNPTTSRALITFVNKCSPQSSRTGTSNTTSRRNINSSVDIKNTVNGLYQSWRALYQSWKTDCLSLIIFWLIDWIKLLILMSKLWKIFIWKKFVRVSVKVLTWLPSAVLA